MNNIIIDFERLKHPNTGLHTFCSMLGKSLLKYKYPDQKLTFYVPAKELNIFSDDESYYTQRSWHKIFRPGFENFTIFHATNQLSKYLPSSPIPKIVLTIHDLNFLIEKKHRKEKIEKELKKIQHNIDRSAIVTTISDYVRKDIEKNFDLKGKEVKVIHNGGYIRESEVMIDTALNRTRPFLFTIGTILPKKNFHVLVSLLRHSEFDLIIAGNVSSPEYANKIMDLAKIQGVDHRVFIIGPITDQEKMWYYKNCHAFLFPSIAEGFGLPIIEAMSFGKPVFLSNHTSLPEIGGNVAYYFPSFEPNEMSDTLEYGLKAYKQENPQAKIKAQAQLFTWEKAAKEYLSLYNTISELY